MLHYTFVHRNLWHSGKSRLSRSLEEFSSE